MSALIQYFEQQAELYSDSDYVISKTDLNRLQAILAQQHHEMITPTQSTPVAKTTAKPMKTEAPAPVVQTAPKQVSQSMETADISATDISGLATQITQCTACRLAETRTQTVPGKGNPQADILIIGEAPGAEEDKQGLPFVGAAGQLLDKILASIDLNLDSVYITNIVKCRPPDNRDPQDDEAHACRRFLSAQIKLIQPKIILALGRIAAQNLLNQQTSLSKLRQQIHQFEDIPLIVTYHPAALLRNDAWKRPTWEDMKFFRSTWLAMKPA